MTKIFKKYPLLPYTDYEKIKHTLPILGKHENDAKQIWYYGVNHCYNPENLIFQDIKSIIQEFQPDLIILEGSTKINDNHPKQKEYFKKILNSNEKENILSGGEFKFTLQQALLNQIKVFCPEPEFIEIINYQTTQFKLEQVFVSKIIEMAVQYFSMKNPEIVIKDYLSEEIEYQSEVLSNLENWKDFDFSWNNFLKLFKTSFEIKFLNASKELIIELDDPIPWSTKQFAWTNNNQISQSECNFRDNYILNQVEKQLLKYSKIFIVYGGSHYYAQKKSLKKILNYNAQLNK